MGTVIKMIKTLKIVENITENVETVEMVTTNKIVTNI